jgi:NADH-ubiquinone oxidoreductase subunit b14.
MFLSNIKQITGIQQYAIGAGLGGAFGYYGDKIRDASLAERDAILRHYLETHPEDFPEPGL